jgi:hypothetical protein
MARCQAPPGKTAVTVALAVAVALAVTAVRRALVAVPLMPV